jgi:hypothetical protein
MQFKVLFRLIFVLDDKKPIREGGVGGKGGGGGKGEK